MKKFKTEFLRVGFKAIYFLWSSMPDAQLINAAESGKLTTLEQIESHVLRMLNDERSEAFVEHFTDTWLGINTLGSMPLIPKHLRLITATGWRTYLRRKHDSIFQNCCKPIIPFSI